MILAVAVATRIVAWWDPVAHVDDQFYLLAGEELLNGRWPYLDIWDRKPLGLFLLYAGIAWISDGSILGLNLVGTAFAAATALVIRQIALRFASATSATLAAVAYLLAMPVFGGQTGQSPVFYNLLIAGAAWLMFRASDQDRAGSIRRHAMGAMLLCGLAMTIKQISFIEGAYFGLAFLWMLKRNGCGRGAVALTGAAMVVVALLPTLLCLAGYAVAGEAALGEFVYANYVSIFERRGWRLLAKVAGAAYFILFLLPLIGMGGLGAVHRWRAQPHDIGQKLLLGWIAAALLGYLGVPAFFDHYTLPFLVPLCISAATAFDRSSRWLLFIGVAGFYLVEGTPIDWRLHQRQAAQYEHIRRTIDQARRGGCVYVADGPSRIYIDFPDCRPSRYLFPDHLVLITEAGAVGVDTVTEVSRILAQRPAVVVTRAAAKGRRMPEIQALLSRSMAENYRPILITPPGYSKSVDDVTIWQRRDLAPPNR
ncbi:hypothetical protein LZ496_00045 [Sphingomonas sp. NSE70-1]|uniref:Dolichyl-phosphate-mannose-protein mannosyltransferase n=1 Tax=Sphingomonas caseinilyticus TaxID=2908205 RepID=A0ABT0RQE8_9SPHN|nr:hypothetical protein [Sphingomonas caseinilyticus]MCL6697181.1 hypothetical protein [Sphingomonas caseinilyticus]